MPARPYLRTFLLLLTAGESIVLLWGRQVGQVPGVLVLWVVGLYTAGQGWRRLGSLRCLALVLGSGLLVAGMRWGPLQDVGWMNHLVHLLCAVVLSVMVGEELRARYPHAPRLLVGGTVFGVVLAAGLGMELAEAAFDWLPPDPLHRFRDTVLDLGSDAVGAAVGAQLAARKPSRRRPRRS